MKSETNAMDIINDALNYNAERAIAQKKDWMRLYDEVFYPVTGIHPDAAEKERENRYAEHVMLQIIEKILPVKALEFYARNAATKRLINKGIISKKSRGGWKINRKRDPRIT